MISPNWRLKKETDFVCSHHALLKNISQKPLIFKLLYLTLQLLNISYQEILGFSKQSLGFGYSVAQALFLLFGLVVSGLLLLWIMEIQRRWCLWFHLSLLRDAPLLLSNRRAEINLRIIKKRNNARRKNIIRIDLHDHPCGFIENLKTRGITAYQ